MTSNRTILITGVTGNQGGAVAQALQDTGFQLRGLTRKPDVLASGRRELARKGVDIVKGDLDDEATLRPALAEARGAYSACRTRGRRASSRKRRRASVRDAGARVPASNTTSTHPVGSADKPQTEHPALRQQSGALRKPCAASASRRM